MWRGSILTDEIEEFIEILKTEEFDRRLLSENPTVIESKQIGALSTEFIQDLRVQKAVPQIEARYTGNKVVEDVYGEILHTENGELVSEEARAGYEHPSDGFVIKSKWSDLMESRDINGGEQLLAAGYSAGYALRNSMSRRLGVNTMEIRCSVRLTHSDIHLVLYDTEPGGAGLCYPIYQNIANVLNDAFQLMTTCTCRNYCESCLLIPRASEYLLRNNLLNRHMGEALLRLKNR